MSRDDLRIVAGPANRVLADTVARELGGEPDPSAVERFPDGELRPWVRDVHGADVYVVQPTGPGGGDSIVALLLLLDACHRAGASRVTAVVPYFGYARQDRRQHGGQAVGARVIADALATAGAERLVVVDPHTPALEALCEIPVEMVTAVPVLAHGLAGTGDGFVVVAPDLGAVKLAERYAALLDTPVAIVRKHRESGSSVHAKELIGDVADRRPIIVDDMISTGGTIEAAAGVLLDHGAIPEIDVAATHGPLVPSAIRRLHALPIRRLLVTDSVAQHDAFAEVHTIAPLLTDTIRRLHEDKPLDDLLIRT